MKNIVVVAKIDIKEAFVEEVYSQLVEIYTQTHAKDEGCIQYELHQDEVNKNCYVFVETWESSEHLDLHMKKEHFLNFVQAVDGKLENLEINRLEKLAL